jgi:putative phosphoribosyl transferase
MLATQLLPKYRYENCVILALNDGGVVVGAQIAIQLHCVIMMLISSEIRLPREPAAVAGITADGDLAFNSIYQKADLDEMLGEYRGYIEQEKIRQIHDLNRLIGSLGTVDKHLLKGHNVIVVSDGISSGFEVDLVFEFLKPIATEKVVFAIPFASVTAVDKIHVLADEIYCLDVIDEYRETAHYYDSQDVPDHDTVIKTIQQIILKWQ